MQTLVIVPTYNEAENILRLAKEITNLPIDCDLLIVDDSSPDGTGKLAARLAAENPRIHLIQRPGKLGLGTAYIAGFRFGLENGASYIITMDADFSHNPTVIPALVGKMDSCDLGIGSRYVPGGEVLNCSWDRRLISLSANLLARWLLGLTAGDCTAGFRCYRRQVLETVDLNAIVSNGYSFLIEMLFFCQQFGFRVGEVPISFLNRQLGTSKISRAEIYKAGATIFRLTVYRLGRLFRRVKTEDRHPAFQTDSDEKSKRRIA